MRSYLLASEFLRPCLEQLLQELHAPLGLLTLPALTPGRVSMLWENLPADCGELLLPEGAALLGEEPLSPPVPLTLLRVHNAAGLLLGDATRYRQLFDQGVLCWGLPGWGRPVLFGPAGDCRCLCALVDTQLGLPDESLLAREIAQHRGWDLLLEEADYSLLYGLLKGKLSDSALVHLSSGQRLERSYDRELLRVH